MRTSSTDQIDEELFYSLQGSEVTLLFTNQQLPVRVVAARVVI